MVGAAEESRRPRSCVSMLDQHLLGPAALRPRGAARACVARRTGAIVQMSSQGGRMSFPGVSACSASQFALERLDPRPWPGRSRRSGSGVMIVEPSRFRTDFHAAGVLELG